MPILEVVRSLLQDPSCGAHFASPCFLALFLPLALGGYWLWPSRTWKLSWLALMSALFYSLYDVRFLPLIYLSAVVDYAVALAMARPGADRRLWLVGSLAFQLSLLLLFKYTLFVAENAVPLLRLAGIDARPPGWGIVLPIGISFYTFHTISYTVDVYRGTIQPERNLLRYLVYISMFPHLVAGPIIRYSEVGHQLRELPRRLPPGLLATGLVLFSIGLLKKIAVADTAAAVADGLWVRAGGLHAPDAWLAVLAYTVQIYFDFSGYSDMALGLAALLAVRFPVNFRAPYQALDPSDFWRRWHISLSRFLRDYLYIPLGGSREGRWVAARNLLIVMVLGGLWHGAGWTFVLWGLGHGLLLVAYHFNRERWDGLPRAFRMAAMLLAVSLLWVLFRSPTLGIALAMFGDLFAGAGALASGAAAAWPVLLALLLAVAFRPVVDWRVTPSRRWGVVAAVALVCSMVLMGREESPFIYYAF